MDEIVVTTNPLIRETKAMLERVKEELDAEQRAKRRQSVTFHPTAMRMDEIQFRSATKKYRDAILRFQQTLSRFTAAKVEDFTRQARIVNPDIGQEQIQMMLKCEDPTQYLQTHIMAVSPHLRDELNELEEEHKTVQKLETSIADIQDLFSACFLLVLESGEQLDDVERNVAIAVESAERGHRQIRAAEIYVKETRKTKVQTYVLVGGCCGFLVLVLLLMFLTPLLRIIT